jgi:hypothetical protein
MRALRHNYDKMLLPPTTDGSSVYHLLHYDGLGVTNISPAVSSLIDVNRLKKRQMEPRVMQTQCQSCV